MLQLTPHHRLLLAVAPIDFRKGIDGLVALCKQHLAHDPFSGTIFVFTNRSRHGVKLLVYDGNGFWLCHKRFSKGTLRWWPTQHDSTITLHASELQVLLAQGEPQHLNLPEPWCELPHAASASGTSPNLSR